MSHESKDTIAFLDVTGRPLYVGALVAWGSAHRSGGLAVGRIEELNILASKPKKWDAATRQYVEGPEVYQGQIKTRSLMRGRKGASFNPDYAGLVIIADQEWPGDR